MLVVLRDKEIVGQAQAEKAEKAEKAENAVVVLRCTVHRAGL